MLPRRAATGAAIRRPGSSRSGRTGPAFGRLDQAGDRRVRLSGRRGVARRTRVDATRDWGISGTSGSTMLDIATGDGSGPACGPTATAQIGRGASRRTGSRSSYLRVFDDARSSSSSRRPTAAARAIVARSTSPFGRTRRRSTSTASRRTGRRSSSATTPTNARAFCRSTARASAIGPAVTTGASRRTSGSPPDRDPHT